MHWTSKQETGKNPEKNFESNTDQIKTRKNVVKGRKMYKYYSDFFQDMQCCFKNFHFFIFRKQHTFIFHLESIQCIGATMHLTKMSKKECGCQNCYDIRLEEAGSKSEKETWTW